jgi:hypothetical protein
MAGRSNMHGDGRGWLAKWANPLLRRYPGWPFVAVPWSLAAARVLDVPALAAE